MTTLRLILFSIISALLLYIPFYYFAPYYRSLYVHVPIETVNGWARWLFNPPHAGIQIYVAYVMMFLVIGLTCLFEYLYSQSTSRQLRRIVLIFFVIGAGVYLWTIGFCPPCAYKGIDGNRILFIIMSTAIAYLCGLFYERQATQVFILFLTACVCMIPLMWSFLSLDYFYLMTPALRTLHGCALNQSYFQYDHLISLCAFVWMKLGLQIDKFHVLIELTYVAFLIGIYFFVKHLFYEKRLVVYFILSLILIRVYGSLAPLLAFPQVSPLRLDLWVVILGLVYWKGPQHWAVGVFLSFLLMFHHAFGMIYSLSYIFFIFVILGKNVLKKGTREYFPNIGWMLAGEIINHFFISSSHQVPALNFLKYNMGFIPIDPRSFFWYVPILVSATFLLLWENKKKISERYFQVGILLVFLAIGNLLYFFGRSHENNLINVASSLWLIFFVLLDLIYLKRKFVPILGVFIVGLVAYFYSVPVLSSGKIQIENLATIPQLFKKGGVNLDLQTLKGITHGNPDIIFLSIDHDFEYYYYGDYIPPKFSPLDSQDFAKDLQGVLNGRILKGADIIVAKNELPQFMQIVPLLNAKYVYKISDFIYISNNRPGV